MTKKIKLRSRRRHNLSFEFDGRELMKVFKLILKSRRLTPGQIERLISHYTRECGIGMSNESIRTHKSNLINSLKTDALTWRRLLKLLRAITAVDLTMQVTIYFSQHRRVVEPITVAIRANLCDPLHNDGEDLKRLLDLMLIESDITLHETRRCIKQYVNRMAEMNNYFDTDSSPSNLVSGLSHTELTWKRFLTYLRVFEAVQMKFTMTTTFASAVKGKGSVVFNLQKPMGEEDA
jgi:hypothetical protein